jgi:FtsP/CotA-like multicopper oxidase with cupredoxin domain
MSSGTNDYFQAVDGSRAAEALITSILINGRGQYFDPRNNESSSTPLERLIVSESDTQYRIRLINGGSAFSLLFSIDDHSLEVISSDGVPFDQSIIVNQIVVGLGERFDVLVNVIPTSTRTSCKLLLKSFILKFQFSRVDPCQYFGQKQ